MLQSGQILPFASEYLCYFPLLVVKGIWHYWTYFSRGLNQMEEQNRLLLRTRSRPELLAVAFGRNHFVVNQKWGRFFLGFKSTRSEVSEKHVAVCFAARSSEVTSRTQAANISSTGSTLHFAACYARATSHVTNSTRRSRAMALRIDGEVLYHLILALEGFMLAALLWKLLRFIRGGHWQRFGGAMRNSLASCWRNIVSRKEDPRVLQRHRATLCRFVIAGSKTFLTVLVFRLLAIQSELRLGRPHGYNPALDPSNILSCLMCFCTVLAQDYFPPWMLDPWFLIMEFSCLFPIFLCDHDKAELQHVTYLTLLPRFINGLCAQRDWLPFICHTVGCCAAVFLAKEGTTTYSFISGQAVTWLMLVSGVHAVRAQTYKNVRISLNLEVRTVELEAVSELLLGFCDAVVEIDSDLKLTEDSFLNAGLPMCPEFLGCLQFPWVSKVFLGFCGFSWFPRYPAVFAGSMVSAMCSVSIVFMIFCADHLVGAMLIIWSDFGVVLENDRPLRTKVVEHDRRLRTKPPFRPMFKTDRD